MVILAGVDLAWSGRNPTGFCAVEADQSGVRLVEIGCEVQEAGELASWLERLGEDVIAAIDAPLIATAERRAEAKMARVYGRQGVYAYAARPAFLEAKGIAEGPRLGRLLADRGWSLDPAAVGSQRRVALEVFPHAITVALLGAGRILRYKKGQMVARAALLDEFRTLLGDRWAAAGLSQCEDLTEAVRVAGGRSLKEREDRLDALACAFAAYHAWQYGLGEDEVFGDAVDGYIAVPRRR
jgi:predicted RNase H-like nuclease